MKNILSYVTAGVLAVFLALTSSAALAGASPSGTFVGASDHITKGGVSIVKTANGGHVVILDTNFSLDGAPDPRVGLGKSGKYDDTTDLGKLVKINGLQAYVVPASVNVANFDEVYIWCRKFSVPLGVAKVK